MRAAIVKVLMAWLEFSAGIPLERDWALRMSGSSSTTKIFLPNGFPFEKMNESTLALEKDQEENGLLGLLPI